MAEAPTTVDPFYGALEEGIKSMDYILKRLPPPREPSAEKEPELLPPELLLLVMKELEKDGAKRTLSTFMLANRKCYDLGQPLLWERIAVYKEPWGRRKFRDISLSHLASLAVGSGLFTWTISGS